MPNSADPSRSDASQSEPASGAQGRIRRGLSFGVRHTLGASKQVLRLILSGFIGASVVLIIVVVVHLNQRPDLAAWHEVELKSEFTRSSAVNDFAGYLELENELFAELDRKLYRHSDPSLVQGINRYQSGNSADPTSHAINWNRTFELTPPDGSARAGVLMLHGMSDSPYSMKHLGQALHRQGAHVVGLRLPGHGTAPSGLVSLEWQDMAAALRLAVDYLQAVVGDQPIYLVGYSNGGALAVHYALACQENDSLPKPAGLVLISPAIGVSPMAALAVWQGRLSAVLGLDKLAWNSILPEYDPYKYNSFAINAGDQSYRLTLEINKQLDRLSRRKQLNGFPHVIAFQSAVDATVSVRAVIANFLERLPESTSASGHELVLFDINRTEIVAGLMNRDPTEAVKQLLLQPGLPFTITALTNSDAPHANVEIRSWRDGALTGAAIDSGIAWPSGIYSLSHVSLPFSPDDEFYGTRPSVAGAVDATYRIGDVVLRGERGVLRISAADQLRLRWNPFYSYLEQRAQLFVFATP